MSNVVFNESGSVKITLTPKSRKYLIELPQHMEKHKKGIRKALFDIGRSINRETKKLIRTGKKTGRIYIIKGKRHQASAPGQSPANLSGKLADSAFYRVSGWEELLVGESAYYAKFLEDGVRGRMRARPHFSLAINNKTGDAINYIYTRVNEEINRKKK